MTGTMICRCCGTTISVTTADIGGTVVCPNSRQLVKVEPGLVTMTAIAVERRPKRRGLPIAWIAACVLVLLLAGGTGWTVIALRTKPTDEARIRELAAVIEPQPATQIVAVTAVNQPTPDVVAVVAVVPDSQSPTPAEAAPPITVAPAAIVPVTPAPVTMPEPKPTRLAAEPKIDETAVVPPAPKPKSAADDAATTTPKAGRNVKPRILGMRIDTRTTEELEKELLAVREVSLDRPGELTYARLLYAEGQRRKAAGVLNPGPVLLTTVRPDLAQLPFVMGPRTLLGRESADNLDALSSKFRTGLLRCIAPGDPRPDPALVEAWLMDGDAVKAEWRTAAAIPCLRQMLPGELAAVRRIACEVYRTTDGPEAVEALVAAAVFDTDFETRNAAVFALSEKPRELVLAKLIPMMDHPWVRAVEHVVEALIALKAEESAGLLAVLMDRPHPATPASVTLGSTKPTVRREMVKTNHSRNCLLCHAPSFDAADKVRASIPDPTRPLSVASYYSSSQDFVRADTTFLRQDFSVVQPVANPGVWPAHQRFDYLIAVRSTTEGEATADDVGRRTALRFGLTTLTGGDRGPTAADWAALRPADAPPAPTLVGVAAQLLSLRITPLPLLELHAAEFGRPLLQLADDELALALSYLRRVHREPGRLALIAYLEPLALRGTQAERDRAAALSLRLLDETAWGSPLTDDELRAARKGLKSGSAGQRRAAGTLLIEDTSELAARIRDLLEMLRSDDPALRRLAAEALGKMQFHDEDLFLALSKVTRDADQTTRIAAFRALTVQASFPATAGEELARSFLTNQLWSDEAAKAEFTKALLALLSNKAGSDEVWLVQLLNAATGETPSDAPPALIAKLIGAHRKVPAKFLPDLVRLLPHPVYGGPAAEILGTLPREAFSPLVTALKSDKSVERAAAAKLLGVVAAVGRPDGVTRDQWRQAVEALAEMEAIEKEPDLRRIAREAKIALTAGR